MTGVQIPVTQSQFDQLWATYSEADRWKQPFKQQWPWALPVIVVDTLGSVSTMPGGTGGTPTTPTFAPDSESPNLFTDDTGAIFYPSTVTDPNTGVTTYAWLEFPSGATYTPTPPITQLAQPGQATLTGDLQRAYYRNGTDILSGWWAPGTTQIFSDDGMTTPITLGGSVALLQRQFDPPFYVAGETIRVPNADAVVLDPFTQPADGGTVIVNLGATVGDMAALLVPGQLAYIPGGGMYEVQAGSVATAIALKLLPAVGSNFSNGVAGSTVNAGVKLSHVVRLNPPTVSGVDITHATISTRTAKELLQAYLSNGGQLENSLIHRNGGAWYSPGDFTGVEDCRHLLGAGAYIELSVLDLPGFLAHAYNENPAFNPLIDVAYFGGKRI